VAVDDVLRVAEAVVCVHREGVVVLFVVVVVVVDLPDDQQDLRKKKHLDLQDLLDYCCYRH
jgi:hypothetical protein